MRLLKFGMGVLAVVIAFVVFALTSSPHDKYPALEPYTVSRTDGFYSLNNMTIAGRVSPPVYAVKFQVHDLTSGEAQLLVSAAPRKPGSGSSMELSQDFSHMDPSMRPHMSGGKMVIPPMPTKVTSITLWRQLKWNEVLWARLTHLGRDPFPPMYPNQRTVTGSP